MAEDHGADLIIRQGRCDIDVKGVELGGIDKVAAGVADLACEDFDQIVAVVVSIP